jgi:putative N6-adenine-specific DNA methylase
MADFDVKKPIFITCPKMIAPYLAKELKDLNFEIISEQVTGVTVEASLFDCMSLNLKLRTAHRILYPLFEGEATNLDELYALAYNYDWKPYIDIDGKFAVKCTIKNVDVNHTNIVNLKVKDAIADRFRADIGKRPNSGASEESLIVSVNWVGKDVKIYLDLSGESLNRRSYKRDNWRASLQESLAAAIVMEAGITSESLVHNPMCGSGTLALEAVMIQNGIWPGILRKEYSIQNIKDFPKDLWETIWRLHTNRPVSVFRRIHASDKDVRAIKAARKNAHALKVDNFIYWEVEDFAKAKQQYGSGDRIFLMNPPYGIRMGSPKEMHDLYTNIGDYLRNQKEPFKALIMSSDQKLLDKIGLEPIKSQKLYNTKIEIILNTYTSN